MDLKSANKSPGIVQLYESRIEGWFWIFPGEKPGQEVKKTLIPERWSAAKSAGSALSFNPKSG